MKRLLLIGAITVSLLLAGCARNYQGPNYTSRSSSYRTYSNTSVRHSSEHHHHHHDSGGHHDGGGHHEGGHHEGGHHH